MGSPLTTFVYSRIWKLVSNLLYKMRVCECSYKIPVVKNKKNWFLKTGFLSLHLAAAQRRLSLSIVLPLFSLSLHFTFFSGLHYNFGFVGCKNRFMASLPGQLRRIVKMSKNTCWKIRHSKHAERNKEMFPLI